jgi:hypothetical protein
MAQLAFGSFELPELDFTTPLQVSEHGLAFRRLLDISDALPTTGEQIVGALLRWQRGDGYAYYIVIKDNPLTVQHVAYLDCWKVEFPLIRGLTEKDVITQLRRRQKIKEIV